MSSEKFKKTKKNLDDPVIQRILRVFDASEISVIAKHYGKTSQNVNGYITRGTLVRLIAPEMHKRNISLDWIKTGKGPMLLSSPASNHPPSADNIVSIPIINENLQEIDSDTAHRYAEKAYHILMSGTGYASALKLNIVWFEKAVANDQLMKSQAAKLPHANEES